MSRSTLPILPFVLVLVALVALAAPASHAATWTVCPSGCDSVTLQGAIDLASSGDLITLTTADPITEDDILVDESVTIQGLGSQVSIVQSAATSESATNRVFHVLPGNVVTLQGLSVRNGREVIADGGCIRNQGTLHLVDVDVLNCYSGGSGGAIHSSFVLDLDDAAVSLSEAADGNGGGIYNGGALTAEDCILSSNQVTGGTGRGGGLYSNGAASLTRCQVLLNDALQKGDGLWAEGGGDLTLTGSTVSGNLGYGIQVYSVDLVLTTTTVSGHPLSAISFATDALTPVGSVRLEWSVLRHNTSGLVVQGGVQADVVSSTISENQSLFSGAGIYATFGAEIRIASSTIAHNRADSDGNDTGDAGGIYLDAGATARLKNSILADNSDGSPRSGTHVLDCSGDLTSDGYNLIENASTSPVTPCTVVGDLTGVQLVVEPQLEPLADNGGPTWTHALAGASPAVDAGNPSGCTDYLGTPLTVDQRGAPRVGVCDLGAFELGEPVPLFADGFESGDLTEWSSSTS